jgi:hypothetical protein
MGNGALPHGPSYRAHPRLYHKRPSALPPEGPLTEVLRTRFARLYLVSRLLTRAGPYIKFRRNLWRVVAGISAMPPERKDAWTALAVSAPPRSRVINLSLISLFVRQLLMVVRETRYEAQSRSCCAGDDALTRRFWHIR